MSRAALVQISSGSAAELHLMPGMGHGSWYGHAHDTLNPFIEELIRRYL